MSTENPTPPGDADRQPSEQELMAAYEEQMKNIRVEEVLVQSLASFIELGGRRAGLAAGPGGDAAPAAEQADPAQLGLAIEVIRALQPLAAPLLGPNASQVDQALSQLQVAYAKLAGPPAGGPSSPGQPGGPGPAAGGPGEQRKPDTGAGPSRLWVPGQ